MPIRVEVIKENCVVLQTYSDPLDNAQMRQLRDKMDNEIFPTVVDKLHIIVDFSAVRSLPSMILTNGSSMLGKGNHKTGMIVCVTPNFYIRSMAQVFASLSPKQSFKIVKSLEEAYNEIDLVLNA